MFITKKHFSRRTVLRGLGVGLGLPLLDAMIPAATALANTAAAPKPRLGFIYFPHGAVMDKWTPKADGANFDFPDDHRLAQALPEAADADHGPGEQVGDRRARACDHARHLAVVRAAAHQP